MKMDMFLKFQCSVLNVQLSHAWALEICLKKSAICQFLYVKNKELAYI